MKVLIGYDGSDSAEAAILGLHRAGLPMDTEACVVTVADVWPQLPTSSFEVASAASKWQKAPIVRKAQELAAQARREAQMTAEAGAELVAKEFPSWKVSHREYEGSPYLALIEPAEGIPDLIIVGAQGKSAVGRWVLGSVSQKVLSHAACSVRISRGVKEAANGGGPVRIILGIDGSVPSASAVSAVASRKWPAGTEVKVIAALDLKFWAVLAAPASSAWSSAWAWAGETDEDGWTWASRAVEAVAEELRSAGLIAHPIVQEGDPKKVLVDEAEQWKADSIFLGAKGHSSLERFLLGSVSSSVAARATCSVEVVRQG